MRRILIAALSPDLVIGRDGKLPWHYPEDMRHFMRTTLGHPCIMGRRTYESFPRRPLPGRLNLVLTRNPGYAVSSGAETWGTLEDALERCAASASERVYILGGEGVFRQAIGSADEMVLTHVPDRVDGDTHFPQWDPATWQIVDTREAGGLRYVTYCRRPAPP